MPSPEYKHFCRVCNKGFTCGSALGGHMRAHGASDDVMFAVDDEDSPGDEPAARWRGGGSSDERHHWDGVGTSTHAYALRANPNRLVRSCQVCKNCGKEFTSWELFLEHGKCSSDDDEARAEADGSPRSSSLISDDAADEGEDDDDPAVAAAWSKGKRSRRVKLMAEASRRCASGEEEEDLANCLVMLSSSANVEHAASVVTRTKNQQEPSSASANSKDGDRGPQLLQPMSFLAPAPEPVVALPSSAPAMHYAASPAPRGMFECKACKKVFTSHQALGGHRASHKKVKGCFAARFESNNVVTETPSHAATTATDPNNDSGKAAAVEATPDAKTRIYTAASAEGDRNVGTSETAALSMSLAPITPFNVAAAPPQSKKNAKMHECSVCHRLFTSGQALGGHKRCHWLTTSSTADPVASFTVPPLTEDFVGAVRHHLMLRPMADAPPEPALDLTIAAKPSPSSQTTAPSSIAFHLDASAQPVLHLQSPAVVPGNNASHWNKASTTSGNDAAVAAAASTAAEDEADSTVVKRARLTDLKDAVRMDGEATEPWLQVGIGSSSAGGDDKNT